jgi:hypothetical protein
VTLDTSESLSKARYFIGTAIIGSKVVRIFSARCGLMHARASPSTELCGRFFSAADTTTAVTGATS